MGDRDLRLLKKCLNNIIQGDLRGISYYFGVCRYLDDILDCNGYDFVNNNCIDWIEFTGDVSYPVRGYFKHNDKWSGKQLELRQSLAQHLLTKVEQNIYE